MKNIILRDRMFEDLIDFRCEFDKMFSRVLSTNPWSKEEFGAWTPENFAPAVEASL